VNYLFVPVFYLCGCNDVNVYVERLVSLIMKLFDIYHQFTIYLYLLKWQSSGSPPSAFRVPYDSFRKQGDCRVADSSDSADMNTYNDAVKETADSAKLDYEFMCFFLSSDRLDLYRSIDCRCEDMLLGSYMNPIHYMDHSFVHVYMCTANQFMFTDNNAYNVFYFFIYIM
jgi:hypothetical protein